MARNEHKRQKKLQKKAARRKSLVRAARSGINSIYSLLTDERRLEKIAQAPIHHCLVPRGIFEMGIGTVIVSRLLESGNIAAGVFLVDVTCLGIKDAFMRVIPPHQFSDFMSEMRESGQTPERVDPAYAVKLIRDSVAYARSIGFEPHKDYAAAQQIFGDIDPAECIVQFEFGRDGKPFFSSGPNETPARSRQIIDTLTRTCGPDGFHYMIGLDPSGGVRLQDNTLFLGGGDEDEEGDEDEDEE